MKIVADICPRKLLGNDSDTYKRIIENDKGKAFCDYFLSQKNSKNREFNKQVQNYEMSL